MNQSANVVRRWIGADVFSPEGFVVRAVIIGIAYLLCRAFGLNAYTSILSGTSPTGGAIGFVDAALAFTYMLTHFAFVLGVPILVMAAGLLWALSFAWTSRRP